MTESQKFPMPFIMELDAAVERIERAIEKKRTEYAFPFPIDDGPVCSLVPQLAIRCTDGAKGSIISKNKRTSTIGVRLSACVSNRNEVS